jgi:hypothetical protein
VPSAPSAPSLPSAPTVTPPSISLTSPVAAREVRA